VTRSGETLTIYFRESDQVFTDVYLEGDARLIYTAELNQDAWRT
jgi:diaminopimelate epimerase